MNLVVALLKQELIDAVGPGEAMLGLHSLLNNFYSPIDGEENEDRHCEGTHME